jgi:hypothetical protein
LLECSDQVCEREAGEGEVMQGGPGCGRPLVVPS